MPARASAKKYEERKREREKERKNERTKERKNAAACSAGASREASPAFRAAFVTSSGTLDKADATAREHIALVGAVRLPEGSFRTEAGTDVVVDILFFRKRDDGESAGNNAWLDLAEVRAATEDEGAIRINRYDVKHGLIVRRRDRRYLDSRFSSSMSVSREGRESPHCQSTRFRSSFVAPGAKLRTIIAR